MVDYLEKKHPHERDTHITFDEGPHIYTIDGDSSFTSVTTWAHSNFGHFDADKIITKMMKGRNWRKSKYFGMSREEIKEGWKKMVKKPLRRELKCIMTLNVITMI